MLIGVMPNYTLEGKILTPLTDQDFADGMEQGTFIKPCHKAYCVLLYYSAVRKTEGQRAMREQFQVTKDNVVFEVGVRLKHSAKTGPLEIPLSAAYVDLLKAQIELTPKGARVFPFCPTTAYLVVHRAFKYPHLFRLSRITNFLLDGYTIPEIQSWTGLTLTALNFYIGRVSVSKMAKSMIKR